MSERQYSKRGTKQAFVSPLTPTEGLWLGEDRFDRNDPIIRLHCFAASYKRAGDTLIESALAGGGPDYSIFPIVFLYRHYFELCLKCLLIETSATRGQRRVPKIHNLRQLWADLEEALGELPRSVKDDVADVKKLIEEFSKLDPTSESFRYPFDTKGASNLDQSRYVDLKTLRDAVSRFDGVYRFVSEVLDLKSEMDCM